MPVIRTQVQTPQLTDVRRHELREILHKEFRGETTPDGPVIFEIPLEDTARIDVLVVWDAWRDVRSEDRTALIQEQYRDEQDRVAQALGVTYQEAIDEQLLPYSVVPMVRQGEVDEQMVRNAMRMEGGILRPGERVDLRFPTFAMAEQAHRNLCDRLPEGYWSLVQTMHGME